jgi:hypothetical protein
MADNSSTQPKAPGLAESLLGAIPIVGGTLYHHALLKNQIENNKKAEVLKQHNSLYQEADAIRTNANFSPQLRADANNWIGQFGLLKQADVYKPLPKELQDAYLKLHTGSTQEKYQRDQQAQAQVPPALTPPPTPNFSSIAAQGPVYKPPPVSMGTPTLIPQGAGRPQVPANAQGPGIVSTGQPAAAGGPDEAPLSLQSQAASINPYIQGPAMNELLKQGQTAAASQAATQIAIDKFNREFQAVGGNPETVPVEKKLEYLSKGQMTPYPALSRGQEQYDVTGRRIAASTVPEVNIIPEGGQAILSRAGVAPTYPAVGQPGGTSIVPSATLPPPPTGVAPQAQIPGGLPPGVTLGPVSPPKLTPAETDDVDTARQLAAKYKFPFDPNLNPRNPSAQIPDQHLAEYRAMKAIQKVDPAMRQVILQSKGIQEAILAMQRDQMPTKADAEETAGFLRNHQMSPSQVRMLGMGRMGSAFPRMVFQAAMRQDPQFNLEESEAEYNLAKSPGFQNTVRYMDNAIESIPFVLSRAKALEDSGLKHLNTLIQAGKTEFSNVDLKRFKTDAMLVGDEIAKIMQGGGTGAVTSDKKLEQAQSILNASDNPAEIKAALEDVQTLIGFRRKSLTKGTYLENAGGGSNVLTRPGGAGANPYR